MPHCRHPSVAALGSLPGGEYRHPPVPPCRADSHDRHASHGDGSSALHDDGDRVLAFDPAPSGETPTGDAADDSETQRTETTSETAERETEPSTSVTGAEAADGARHSTWVDRDDVLRESRDRQVLVVGDTTVGRVLAGLLRRAGYDPVLAAAGRRTVEPAATVLDAGALDVLAAAGVAGRVRERGTEVATVASTWPGAAGGEGASSVVRVPETRRSPVVLETATVRRLVDAECGTGAATTARTVDAVAPVDDGLEVAFEDGVREWFDVVVDVAGTRLSRGASAPRGETASLRQYETRVAVRPDGPADLRDVWTTDALVQCLPVADATATLLRVTTRASGRWAGLRADDVADRLPADAHALSAALADVDPTVVRQRRHGDAAHPEAWGRGRVARCGVAASPVAPASGRTVSRGIRDAGALVAELARGRRAVDATVDAYAADRERAVPAPACTRTDEHDHPGGPASAPADDGLRALARERRHALASLVEPTHAED